MVYVAHHLHPPLALGGQPASVVVAGAEQKMTSTTRKLRRARAALAAIIAIAPKLSPKHRIEFIHALAQCALEMTK